MSTKRFIGTVVAVFFIAQVFAIVIHGFILGADYRPFYGTLIRPMDAPDAPTWMVALLPLAHLAMAVAFVALFSRWVRPGPEIPQGLRFGVLAWLFAAVPMYLLRFAEQPWPLSLTIKQLMLELFTMLVLGTFTAMLYRPAPFDNHQL
ncbi:MAG TPA: hypothetical protein VFM23_05845 [Gemmatimonadales bacterium]|nr:hypothetical protein [Gemmatimonadales bacterium]